MPGTPEEELTRGSPPYLEAIAVLHRALDPAFYLEIGVRHGRSLELARCPAIGVDPAPELLVPQLPPTTRLSVMTSDDFFARLPADPLPQAPDFAFIDGMHWFEYALRDFINVEAWCAPGSTIVLHDCVPLLPPTASRERRTKFWVGDVWKVVSILRERRPELRVKIIATAPSGLCVVRGLDPKSTVLREQLSEIVERYQDLPYPAQGLSVPEGFDLVPATSAGLSQALS